MLREFKEFALKGSVLDLAIGIIIGAAFTALVNSFVENILMPPLGLLMGPTDFSNLFVNLTSTPYGSLAEAEAAGAAVLKYGLFINNLIQFLIMAFVVFMLVRQVNKLRHQPEEASNTKECPYCTSAISLTATRCPNCTSQLTA